MSVVLTWRGSTPGQPQFGLSTLTERYKVQNDDGSQITAAAVMVDSGVPQIGDAHPDYAGMFCTDRRCPEMGESASELEVTYTGILDSDLPPTQHSKGKPIQTATASFGSNGLILASPASIQFYARTNSISYISAGGPGSDVPADPTEDIVVINYTVGQASFATGGFVNAIIPLLFEILITEAPVSQEIVAGQYWQNTSTKTKAYVPFAFDIPSGPFLTLADPGDGYTIGDTLTITGGSGTAVIVLTSVGGVQGTGVLAWTVSSNSMTISDTLMSSTGGTGSGAKFNVTIYP